MNPKRIKPSLDQGKRYVIIGNSAAGIAAAKEIRRYDLRGQITIISDEPSFGYSRVLLPLYIAGKIRKREMLIAPKDFYPPLRIRLLRNDPVLAIDPKAQRVHTRRGTDLPYDSLLVATGSSPRELLESPGRISRASIICGRFRMRRPYGRISPPHAVTCCWWEGGWWA